MRLSGFSTSIFILAIASLSMSNLTIAIADEDKNYASAEEIRESVVGSCFKGSRDWEECYHSDGKISGYYKSWKTKGNWSVKGEAENSAGTFVLTYPNENLRRYLIVDGNKLSYYTTGGKFMDTATRSGDAD